MNRESVSLSRAWEQGGNAPAIFLGKSCILGPRWGHVLKPCVSTHVPVASNLNEPPRGGVFFGRETDVALTGLSDDEALPSGGLHRPATTPHRSGAKDTTRRPAGTNDTTLRPAGTKDEFNAARRRRASHGSQAPAVGLGHRPIPIRGASCDRLLQPRRWSVSWACRRFGGDFRGRHAALIHSC
jgi:hypothetical protein